MRRVPANLRMPRVALSGRARWWRLGLVTLAVVAVCAGCRLDVGVAITMAPDGSGTVAVTATADPELVTAAPTAFADLRLDDVKQAGWTVSGPAKGADGSMAMTLTKPFATPAQANTILAELNGPAGPLVGLTVGMERSFAVVASTLAGHAQLTGGLAAFSDAALAQALGSVPLANLVTQPADQVLGLTVTAHFPGQVVSTDGQIAADRQSVVWQPSLADGAVTPINARFELVDQGARDARRTSHLAWGALVLYLGALLVVVVLVTVVLRRRRRPHSSSP